MNHHSDDDLRRLLREAVDEVEPGDRIAQIRSRTRTEAPAPWRRRTAIGGAVLATAAAVTAVAVLPVVLGDDPPDGTTGPAVQVASQPPGPDSEQTVPAYFVGDGPRGPRLYREFVVVDGSDPRLLAALRALEQSPDDPDYGTWWAPGSFVDATYSSTERLITVDLASADSGYTGNPPPGPDSLPLAVQQAIYTAQGAVGEGRVPVRFRVDGQTAAAVLGEPTGDSVTNAPVLDTLSLMSISYPFQGADVSGSFTASGVNNSFEATVIWRLEDGSGAVVRDGFTTAQGWGSEKLFPWEAEVDVSGLPPGDYTFIAENDDPSGGAEGNGPDSDTRLVVIE